MSVQFFEASGAFGELSNFFVFPEPIVWGKKTFATSEHVYHYLKYWHSSSTEASREYAELIRKASTPFKAKLLANQTIANRWPWQRLLNPVIQKYLNLGVRPRADWDAKKREQMKFCLLLKFRLSKICRDVLLSTGEQELIEASPHDKYWGVGRDGTGQNTLGILLMEVRAEIALLDLEEEDSAEKKWSLRSPSEIKILMDALDHKEAVNRFEPDESPI